MTKDPFFQDKKKLKAMGIVSLLIVSAIVVFFIVNSKGDNEIEYATIDDLLNSRSERKGNDPDVIIVEKEQSFMTLVSTPVAVYYEGSERVSSPLLCTGENLHTPNEGPSKSTSSFLDAYTYSDILGVGDLPDGFKADTHVNSNSAAEMSSEIAQRFWTSSDGAILVENDQTGYEYAVNAVVIASYLNIPVIVADSIDSQVERTLSTLSVKYTIICGDLDGYGKIWPLKNSDEIHQIIATGIPDENGELKSIITDRLGTSSDYIVMANPNDIIVPTVTDSITEEFSGVVSHSDTGSTSFPSSSSDAPTFYMDIPDDYKYARVIVDSVMDCVPPRNFGTAQSHGERSYIYFGMDEDNDGQMVNDGDAESDGLHFMSPSLAYSYSGTGSNVKAICHSDYPIFNSTGQKCIQIKASLDYKILHDSHLPGPGIIEEAFGSETTFTIKITVEKLDSHNYPRLVGGSSLAPYLAAFRGGVVLSNPSYSIHDEGMLANPNCGDPTANEDLYQMINLKTYEVKSDLNSLLGDLNGFDGENWGGLAELCKQKDEPTYVGIIADPFMVPLLYYENTQADYGESEGFGTASDNGYGSIDADLENLPYDLDGSDPTMELAVGRMTGWDIQDTSSLLARTFFYDDIIDSYPGHSGSFKDSAMSTHGTVIPVGAAETVVRKLEAAYSQAGFTVDANHNFALSDSKFSASYYETSNFIFECAHGHYYWFVPAGYKDTSAGGGFTVTNVKDMNFGPGVLFASSCVTGKIDGIPLYNGISQSFIHSGMNAYVGASRLSWGSLVPSPMASPSGEALGGYMGLLFYGYLTGYVYDRDGGLRSEDVGDMTVGAALMHAKNDFIAEEGTDSGGPVDDTVEEFNLHGDPAFNPYEPNHSG